MAWLKDGLSKSTAHFKILLNSVPMTDMPLWYVGASDRWEGYQAQREELLDHIADNGIEHVVCLSGDFHIGFVAHVDESGAGKGVREIAVGPGGNLNPAGLLPFPSNQFSFSHGWPQATTELVFDPGKGPSGTIRVRFVRADNGNVLYDEELPG
jgi:hypothetical protein